MSVPATTFHLIRHATYDLLDRGILAGRTPGWSLNEEGRAQAATLARSLADQPFAALIASPLERAQETAAAIARLKGMEVETDPDFNEVDFGAWSNNPFAALRDNPHWIAFNSCRSVMAAPDGESLVLVQARVLAGLKKLAARFPGAEVAVVSHGDVIKAALVFALGMPLDLFQRIEISPASRSVVLLGEGFIRVLGINLRA